MLASSNNLTRMARYLLPNQVAWRLEKALYQSGMRSAADLTLPDFLCMGFRKAGTTWLFENLHHHPDIYLPPYKNVRYFSDDFHTPLRGYAEHFSTAQGRVSGDFSNSYAFVSEAKIRFIRAVMPQVKLIVLLRDPVEREWSEFLHRLTMANKDISSLSDDEVRQSLATAPLASAGGYTPLIDGWLNVFPEEQLFVGFYEQMDTQPRKLLSDLFEFLGVTTDIDWDDVPYNKVIIPPAGEQYESHDPWRGVIATKPRNTSALLPEHHRAFLRELYERELAALRACYGDHVAHWGRERERVAA